VETTLNRVVGKASPYVTDEAQYRQAIIRPGWEALPVAIRMAMRRQYQRWDDFCLAVRDQAFDLVNSKVSLQPDLHARLVRLVNQFFGAAEAPTEKAAEPAAVERNGVPSPRPAPAVAVASPVAAGSAKGANIPMAMPVNSAKAAASSTREARQNSVPTGIAVGIDLGTTYSVIAYVDSQGRPSSIPNAAGELLTPSVVLFDEAGTIVGKEAVQASAMEPEKVAECVKRDMGGKVYRKKINNEHLPPEVISSIILRSLKADGERKLGAVCQAVITVPAYFEETRRRATMDAGRLAGLQVLDIINEPTAAAIAYGYQVGFLDRSCKSTSDKPLRVLVFDLGGGTFDVTIVEIQGTSFKALATDGDVNLGGKDWDEKLISLAAERFRQQFREDPRDNPMSHQELALAAESAKRTLTERNRAAIFVNHQGSRLRVEVTRQEFEEATAALVARTRMTTEIVLREAKLTWADIDRVLLVGGATRMPMIVRMLMELTGKQPDQSISADEAVAHGAALYAELLAPHAAREEHACQFSVTNINSHSLGILGADPATGHQLNRILIPKNMPLPKTVSKVFRTLKANQHSVVIKVLEGESERPEACSQIGVCTIRDLPPDLPSGWPVRVSYTYGTNGRLHVSAKVQGHGAEVTADLLRENSLPDDDLDMWARYIAEETQTRN
jgi:molecular chaperone DnaK